MKHAQILGLDSPTLDVHPWPKEDDEVSRCKSVPSMRCLGELSMRICSSTAKAPLNCPLGRNKLWMKMADRRKKTEGIIDESLESLSWGGDSESPRSLLCQTSEASTSVGEVSPIRGLTCDACTTMTPQTTGSSDQMELTTLHEANNELQVELEIAAQKIKDLECMAVQLSDSNRKLISNANHLVKHQQSTFWWGFSPFAVFVGIYVASIVMGHGAMKRN